MADHVRHVKAGERRVVFRDRSTIAALEQRPLVELRKSHSALNAARIALERPSAHIDAEELLLPFTVGTGSEIVSGDPLAVADEAHVELRGSRLLFCALPHHVKLRRRDYEINSVLW